MEEDFDGANFDDESTESDADGDKTRTLPPPRSSSYRSSSLSISQTLAPLASSLTSLAFEVHGPEGMLPAELFGERRLRTRRRGGGGGGDDSDEGATVATMPAPPPTSSLTNLRSLALRVSRPPVDLVPHRNFRDDAGDTSSRVLGLYFPFLLGYGNLDLALFGFHAATLERLDARGLVRGNLVLSSLVSFHRLSRIDLRGCQREPLSLLWPKKQQQKEEKPRAAATSIRINENNGGDENEALAVAEVATAADLDDAQEAASRLLLQQQQRMPAPLRLPDVDLPALTFIALGCLPPRGGGPTENWCGFRGTCPNDNWEVPDVDGVRGTAIGDHYTGSASKFAAQVQRNQLREVRLRNTAQWRRFDLSSLAKGQYPSLRRVLIEYCVVGLDRDAGWKESATLMGIPRCCPVLEKVHVHGCCFEEAKEERGGGERVLRGLEEAFKNGRGGGDSSSSFSLQQQQQQRPSSSPPPSSSRPLGRVCLGCDAWGPWDNWVKWDEQLED